MTCSLTAVVPETARARQLKKNAAKKTPNFLYFQVIQNPTQSPTPYSIVTVQSCELVTKKEENKTNIAWRRHVEKAFVNQRYGVEVCWKKDNKDI